MLFRSHAPTFVSTPSPKITPAGTAGDFTLSPPAGYTMSTPSDGIYTIENKDGRGLQITVTHYDEPGPITEERIRQDLPDAEINEPGQAKLDGTLSFLFYGYDEDMGDTFEVWSVHGGKLFQIMAAKSEEKMIENILDTWKWQ